MTVTRTARQDAVMITCRGLIELKLILTLMSRIFPYYCHRITGLADVHHNDNSVQVAEVTIFEVECLTHSMGDGQDGWQKFTFSAPFLRAGAQRAAMCPGGWPAESLHSLTRIPQPGFKSRAKQSKR